MKLKKMVFACIPARICLTSRGRNLGRIAMTFDDGPHPDTTEKILAVLDRQNVKATFFMSGKEIEQYPDIAAKVWAGGHAIGNHGYTHAKMKDIGFDAYCQGIERTNGLIEGITQAPCRLFRPPFGEVGVRLLCYTMGHAMTTVLWSVDSNDSFVASAQELKKSMYDAAIKSGDILLLHDDYGTTCESLDDIITNIKQRDLKFMTMREMLE